MMRDVFVWFSAILSWKKMLFFVTSYLSQETSFSSLASLLKAVNRNGKLDKLSCDLLFSVMYHKMDWMAKKEDNCGLDLQLRTAGSWEYHEHSFQVNV